MVISNSVNDVGTMATPAVPVTPGPGVEANIDLFSTSDGPGNAYAAVAKSTVQCVISAVIQFTAAGQTLFIATPAAATGVTYWDVVIVPFNTNVAAVRRRAKTSLDKKLAERDHRLRKQEERLLALEHLLSGRSQKEEDTDEVGAAAYERVIVETTREELKPPYGTLLARNYATAADTEKCRAAAATVSRCGPPSSSTAPTSATGANAKVAEWPAHRDDFTDIRTGQVHSHLAMLAGKATGF